MLDVTRNGNKTTSSCYVSNSILNNSGLGEEGGIGGGGRYWGHSPIRKSWNSTSERGKLVRGG